MKLFVGIQARTNSTRLFQKIYHRIGDKSILQHVYDRCLAAGVGEVRILGPKDDQTLAHYCQEHKLPLTRPDCPENDLLSRYDLSMGPSDEGVIRVTSDCWDISPKVIKECANLLQTLDYVSNCITRSFREGDDVQGCSQRGLTWFNRTQKEDREHPFLPFDTNAKVRLDFVTSGLRYFELTDFNNVIFQHNSIDTMEDLERARKRYGSQGTGK